MSRGVEHGNLIISYLLIMINSEKPDPPLSYTQWSSGIIRKVRSLTGNSSKYYFARNKTNLASRIFKLLHPVGRTSYSDWFVKSFYDGCH